MWSELSHIKLGTLNITLFLGGFLWIGIDTISHTHRNHQPWQFASDISAYNLHVQ